VPQHTSCIEDDICEALRRRPGEDGEGFIWELYPNFFVDSTVAGSIIRSKRSFWE
jgi:hypothetical protein